MEISENIGWVREPGAEWVLCRNRSWRALVQRGDPEREYNVPGRPGEVYNFMEDSISFARPGGIVVTGLMGEMWAVNGESTAKYTDDPESLGDEPRPLMTRELAGTFAAIRIPAGTEFSVKTAWGGVLNGNRPGIGHGQGDMLLVGTREENGRTVPDLESDGRVVNGEIFDLLYRRDGE